MKARLALPKGRLQGEIAHLLAQGGLRLENYEAGSRSYRPRAVAFPGLVAKVFQEKDIPVQVAIGNYDLGICGLDWVEEHLVRFSRSSLVKVRALGVGKHELWVVATPSSGLDSLTALYQASTERPIRIVSEYANLAEAFVFQKRLRRFLVWPVWGAAEAYLPEQADVALVTHSWGKGAARGRLRPVAQVLSAEAVLIANRESFAREDLSHFLALFHQVEVAHGE